MSKSPERGRPRRLPEVLAPAGDETALAAALQAGADAVYFGLAEGFNARARAGNFSFATLDATVARIHRAGAKAYLTLNTLVFETELAFVEELVRRAAATGVDALIVQDPAVARIAQALCPALEVHASTQLTITSPESAEFARSLGVTRVVVPRELSVAEIRAFAAGTTLELEVFIHGALCVAWSGQCLTSATWSGRSANRGECAQSCRLPYDIVLDGETRELGDVKYLLSPKDLAGVRAVEELVDIGVHGLKIEGRQKNAQYVLTATETYRHWVDALGGATDAEARERARRDIARASLSYTRGFSDGFLGGSDHQTLVEGRFPKHRGVYLGRVARVVGDTVLVERDPAGRPWTGALAADETRGAPAGEPSAALTGFGGAANASEGPRASAIEPRAGMGIVFDAGEPEDQAEPGGPIFHVDAKANGWSLGFGTPGPDLARVRPGQRAWLSGDPSITREAERAVRAPEPEGRVPVELVVRGALGEPLVVDARARHAGASVRSNSVLTAATGRGLDAPLLEEKLASFGGTPFRASAFDVAGLAAGLHLPVSELKALRRALVDALLPQVERGPVRTVASESVLGRLRERTPETSREGVDAGSASTTGGNAAVARARVETTSASAKESLSAAAQARLVALCRDDAQLEAAIECGLAEVELDWMEMVGLAKAVERARSAGLAVVLATVRVQKPGEEGYDRRLAALAPDGVLVRNWGAMVAFQKGVAGVRPPVLHGDFSLNVTNSITAKELLERGLDTLTPSHDLDREQLAALLSATEPARWTFVLQHRIPTFHTEHCVYAHLLSHGRDFRTCGRPCEKHRVALRDEKGREHPVIVDVGCRNTVFNAEVQSSAELALEALERGVRRFRVEFVRETRGEAAAILGAHRELLAGRLTPRAALERAHALGRVGVSERMSTLR